ncbi:MAG: sugar phosphate nucleotidyltransferase, partial [Acidimicrobiia bacterium]|nr:sugar phosphate nucleotidyltransferase [Acidimicrobiia bacterium]
MKVVLFCGGQGMRLRDYSEKVPKPMVPVGPRPILWHVMKYYAQYGHTDFILCLGHHAEPIKRFFLNYEEAISNDFVLREGGREIEMLASDIHDWTITFVDTGLNADVGERLLAVRDYLEGDEVFLANYADGVTDLDLAAYIAEFEATGKTASLLGVRPPQSYHVVNVDEAGEPLGVGPIGGTDLWLNGGYFVFRNEIFDFLEQDDDLVDGTFNLLIGKGELHIHRFDGWWSPMDTF